MADGYVWHGDPALSWKPREPYQRVCGDHRPWLSFHRQRCDDCRWAYNFWRRAMRRAARYADA